MKLEWEEFIDIFAVVVIIRLISFYDNTLATAIELAAFLFLPCLLKGELKNCAIAYSIHTISQGLSLSIRSLPLYLQSANFVTMFCFGIESYLWLFLLMLTFSYKKEKGE